MNDLDPYTELAYFYDILEDETYEKYIEMLVIAIKERFPNLNNAVLAEIGGGTGLVTYRIYDKVKKLIYVEPSEHMLKVAKAKIFLSFIFFYWLSLLKTFLSSNPRPAKIIIARRVPESARK